MLILSRKISRRILIGPEISITVVKIEGNQVRLGITAPPNVTILRDELAAGSGPATTGHDRPIDRARSGRTRELAV